MKTVSTLALLTCSSLGLAQTFTNPNFSGNANGWTIIDANFGGYSNNPGSDGSAGYMWLNSNGTSTIPRAEQTVSGFTVGQQYSVSYWMRTQVIYSSGAPFDLQIDGNTVQTGPDERLDQWTQFSHTFEATNATHTFTWRAEITADSDYQFDTVSLEPVPEPATMAILGGGALLALRRRKR